MSGFSDVQYAAIKAWKGIGMSAPCAYDGKNFIPPVNKAWNAAYILPVGTQPAALGALSPLEHVVLMQIDLNQPLDSGTQALLADADTIADVLRPGNRFSYGGVTLLCEKAERSAIMRTEGYIKVVLTVRFRGWEFRTA